MDERDLYQLADEPLPPHASGRSLDGVVRRGEQLRRRRRAVRGLGMTSVAAAVLVGAVLVMQQPEPDTVAGEGPAQEPPAEGSNRPWFLGCTGEGEPGTDGGMPDWGADLPPEVTDGLRFLPTWLPEGMAVDATADLPEGDNSSVHTGQSVRRTTWQCRHADPALTLWASGGDATVEAAIHVEGPYPGGVDLSTPEGVSPGLDLEETDLRGQPASRHVVRPAGGPERIGFAWTEPDGVGWWISGVGVDEATIRAVADALQLNGAADTGTPAADMPAEARPEGFEVAWQADGVPAVADPVQATWSASFANAACYVIFETGQFQAPAGVREYFFGSTGMQVTVRGEPGLVTSYGGGPPEGGTELVWQESPTVVGRVGCNNNSDPTYDPGIEPETLVRIADSLEPVAVDDPRFG